MIVVIDPSAVVDALVGDPVHPALLALLSDAALHAPALLDFEVASALRGHAQGGKLDQMRLDEAVEDFIALGIERHQMTDALGQILDLRDNFTVYDATYVVLAQALEAPLVTRDAKMGEARRVGVDVRIFDQGARGPPRRTHRRSCRAGAVAAATYADRWPVEGGRRGRADGGGGRVGDREAAARVHRLGGRWPQAHADRQDHLGRRPDPRGEAGNRR